jgi:type II secretory pathway pseudopilin PulG
MKTHRRPQRSQEGGYILLILMFFVAVLVITAAVVVPEISFQVKRDREEELIHRGVQYSRAIRHYIKKFGRYPTRIEDLESTNNLRFLRKRYKDPIAGKDFKLLHVGEVQLMPGAGVIPGTTPASAMPGANPAPQPAAPNPPGQDGTSDTKSQGDQSQNSNGSGDNLTGQVFGGGPIVGVVSTSKDESIREFNNKNHYNQWQFIYDPSTDRGGLLNTPAQPSLQGAAGLAGAPATGLQTPHPQGPVQPQLPVMGPPIGPPEQQPQQQ